MAVDLYQVILGGIAVAIMVLVPILSVLLYDLLVGRWDEGIERWRERRSSAAEHRRAVRELRHQQGVPIEQLAADLRRLRAILGTDAHRSAAHQMGNRLAYDKLLMQVCEMLEIEHDLERDSIGFERDIERIRVEADLERAGLILSDRRYRSSSLSHTLAGLRRAGARFDGTGERATPPDWNLRERARRAVPASA